MALGSPPLGHLLGGKPTLRKSLAGRLASRADLHLGVEVGEVSLDGGLREGEGSGYLAVRQPAGREEQYLQFSARGLLSPSFLPPLERPPGNGHDKVLPVRARRILYDSGPHRRHELLEGCALEQV